MTGEAHVLIDIQGQGVTICCLICDDRLESTLFENAAATSSAEFFFVHLHESKKKMKRMKRRKKK